MQQKMHNLGCRFSYRTMGFLAAFSNTADEAFPPLGALSATVIWFPCFFFTANKMSDWLNIENGYFHASAIVQNTHRARGSGDRRRSGRLCFSASRAKHNQT